MIIRFLFLAYFFIPANSFAQALDKSSIAPEILDLCKTIGASKSIVSLGESTHGTKEFTKLRADMVKELVTNYGFRILVLEGDYIPCFRINEYILSGNGNPEALLKDVLLWPWINQGFLDLINWMKDYNIDHPKDPVYFYGMDSQFSKLYATKDSVQTNYPDKSKAIVAIVEGKIKPKNKIKELRKLSEQILNESKEIDLRLHYYIMCQINRIANSEYRNLNARDKSMSFLTELIERKFNKKMMLWAHNGHLKKALGSIYNNTSAGYHLGKKYGDDYVVVGFDFKEGDFNAVSFDEEDKNTQKVFTLKPIEKTLSLDLDFESKELLVVDCSTIKQKYYLNSIGAIYVKNPEKGDAFCSRNKRNEEFDFLVITKRSTPTKLLVEWPGNE